MSERAQCPFCGEPAVRHGVGGMVFRCGTRGPDAAGEYDTGHTCDVNMFSRINQALQAQRDDARNAARWCYQRLIIGRDQDAAAKRWPWIEGEREEV